MISRFLGVFRDRVIASQFGASGELDSYYAAFRIPDLLFNLLILGALSSAFVPVFSSYISKNKTKKAFQIANSLLNIILLILVGVSIIFIYFMPHLMQLIAPGLSPEQQELTIDLSRVLLLSPIFFTISNIFTGILNSYRKFIAHALSPIMYNLGIIAGALFLTKDFGTYGLAIGVLIGAFLHAAVQFPAVIRIGYKYAPILKIDAGVKKIGKLMAPRTFGLGMMQINLLVITAIASTLDEGSITIFTLSNNLQSFPVGIFGISIALSAFPVLAEAISKNQPDVFQERFAHAMRRIILFMVPISIIFWILRLDIVRLAYGSGAFDWEDTILTSEALGLFAIGLLGSALIQLFARTFYAAHNTKTPVIVSIFSMIINIVLSLYFGNIMGVAGLALAYSIAQTIQAIVLLVFIKKDIKTINLGEVSRTVFNVVVSSTFMLIVMIAIERYFSSFFDKTTFFGVLLHTAAVICLSLLFFIGVMYTLKDTELKKTIQEMKDVVGSKIKS